MRSNSKVSNPLTVIAIFAGIAEVSGTITLANVPPEIQLVFVWFVMIFPVLLILLFFLALLFNPKVLYAPSDFENQQHFMELWSSTPKLDNKIKEDWDTVKTRINKQS